MATWTKEQQQAIDARNCNLLVAAAAGSGKTAVLVERIIQMITKDRIDIDKLLIVTFTNAAAGEMRERIGAAIAAAIEKEEADELHLRRQLNLLGKASISTLHAFCIEVVRKYFHLIAMDPNFRIGDTTETAILKLEAMEDLFEEEYEKENPLFFGLIERFGGSRDDKDLQDLVLRLHEFILSKPYPEQWLREKIEEFQMDIEALEKSPWYQEMARQIHMELKGAKEILEEALILCDSPEGPAGYRDALRDDFLLVEELIHAMEMGMEAFYHTLKDRNHQRLGRLGKDVSEALKEQVQKLRGQVKELLDAIDKELLAKSPEEYAKDLHGLYPYMNYMGQMIIRFGEIYGSKKWDRGIVDFNDLEHYALAILENQQAAEEYRKKFTYIFVDEYQDSNIVQETIIRHIARENNLFMVGDVKQSIYRFRLADPSLFIEKYETYQKDEQAVNRKIDLSKNFRSRGEILHGVNTIFGHIMTKELGEISYDENARLYPGAETEPIQDPAIEVYLVDKNYQPEELEEQLEDIEDTALEAKLIAGRIKELLKEEIYDYKRQCYRKLTYRDMVILLRTTKNWTETFLEILTAEGIPVYADVNSGYFEALEVHLFVDLLRVIDNKRQDIPLLSVMRSPIGNFGVQDLINIRTSSKAKTFYEALEEYTLTQEDELQVRLSTFLSHIRRWKEEARYIPMDEFIWKLLTDTGYYDYIGAMPGGHQRQANIRILFDRARQFQKTAVKGLFHFIKFIDKLKNSSGDMGTAKTLGENDDVVRLMSIHKSKGLEFPVVFAAGMGKQFNLMDTNEKILLHKDLGIGPQYVDPEMRQYHDTLPKTIMKNKIKIECLSEEMRILYVALTRPKDKLILTGAVRDVEKHIAKWAKPLSTFNLSKGKTYFDWIGPSLLRHRDGDVLRQAGKVLWSSDELWEDASPWRIHLLKKSDILSEQGESLQEQRNIEAKFQRLHATEEGPWADLVNERLNWQYPYPMTAKIPSKLSVTEIKQIMVKEITPMGMNIPSLIRMPQFLDKDKKFSGVEKGTIIHFVMQHVDLKRVYTASEIQEQLEEMVKKELLHAEEAEIVNVKKILCFFQSPIGKRILQAQKVYREKAFNFIKKAEEVIPDLVNCEEELLIQGVIDCYFEEEDEFILVDYKTDYIPYDKKAEIVNNYSIQIRLYREALEKITGRKVKESYLYLFYLDEEVKL
ncbi:MAG: helicase-exonuclease AddAB subunit AddA [Bacillota bacterium]